MSVEIGVGLVWRCWERCKKGVEECVGTPTSPHLSASLHTFPHFNTTSTLTPYTLPHLAHIPDTSLTPQHTFPFPYHIFPLLPFMFPSYLTQLLKLPKIPRLTHHPQVSQILFTPPLSPNSFPYCPILALLLISYQNFLLCSFIAKFNLAIK